MLLDMTSLDTNDPGHLEFSGPRQRGQEGDTKDWKQKEQVRWALEQHLMFLLGSRRGYSMHTEHFRMLRSRTVPGFKEEASDSLTGTFAEETHVWDLVLTIFVWRKLLLVNVLIIFSYSVRFQYYHKTDSVFFIFIDFNKSDIPLLFESKTKLPADLTDKCNKFGINYRLSKKTPYFSFSNYQHRQATIFKSEYIMAMPCPCIWWKCPYFSF